MFQSSDPGKHQSLELFHTDCLFSPSCSHALVSLNLNAGIHISPIELSSRGLESSFWTVEMALNPASGVLNMSYYSQLFKIFRMYSYPFYKRMMGK